ncbi:alpha/beta fold hydrolase [Streptomyces alkaliterrae]|uniref:Alpha/beta hydrolase n=1 Tax=Streptomyces alkaliterrae TaxID=2213162 RepID=A0A5P0YU90_9ACTN|nr:alpha/beta hydrolase [Streptomyces alkaliterrae]MBB1259117.1 alpha/beta hydrolase [Streptomyces alkaliterrae]MQS03875.1 alpha/beta hydrolase [Streptomyces alkaliterrae]
MTGTTGTPAGATPPLAELAGFAALHAKALGITRTELRQGLAAIRRDGTPDAWPRTWNRLAAHHQRADRPLHACRAHVLARFPYPADEHRRAAGDLAVRAFDTWRRSHGDIRRLELTLSSGTLTAWAAGLEPRAGRPLLLVMGGIISVKEQWAPFLAAARRLGVAVVVTEMPGVGENAHRYGPHSVEMIPELLDELGAAHCAAGVQLVALSFAGQLALSAAAEDPRITAVHTVGAPTDGVFRDPAVWATLPRTTTATLAHLAQREPPQLEKELATLALDEQALARVRVPVRYVASRRDEIIPRREWERLAEHLPDFTWVEFDDVHGSPAHLADTRLWLLHGVLDALGDRRARALAALLAVRGRADRGGTTRTHAAHHGERSRT